MGHQKTTLATTLYSDGFLPDHWRKAVEALGEVMEAEVLEAL
jgi:hypothetical protein